jgi:hypothetical protein
VWQLDLITVLVTHTHGKLAACQHDEHSWTRRQVYVGYFFTLIERIKTTEMSDGVTNQTIV